MGDGSPAGDRDEVLRELERQMERGSMFTQASLDRVVSRLMDTETFVNELVDVLRARGVLRDEDLSEPVPDGEPPPPEVEPLEGAAVDVTGWDDPDSPVGSLLAGQWPSIAYRLESADVANGPPVNCAERMHVCHAVCCKLNFALTLEEVDDGKVKWDLGYPFLLRHNAEGRCVHNDKETGGCTVYEDRPGVCRRYSCVNDKRIWKDFDNMVLNDIWLDTNLADPARIRLRSEPHRGA